MKCKIDISEYPPPLYNLDYNFVSYTISVLILRCSFYSYRWTTYPTNVGILLWWSVPHGWAGSPEPL